MNLSTGPAVISSDARPVHIYSGTLGQASSSGVLTVLTEERISLEPVHDLAFARRYPLAP